jgi:hypothetical protein
MSLQPNPQPTQLPQPRVDDPETVPEIWVNGSVNISVTGPVATITFSHVRPNSADLFAGKQPATLNAVVRARIVMPMEGLAGLKQLLDQLIIETAPSSSATH